MPSPQVIVNRGKSGSLLNGVNGGSAAVESSDAVFLDWPGDNGGDYVYLPGFAGNYLSVPNEAALDITGDIDLRVYVALDDWTPSVNNALISKYGGSGTRSWYFRVATNGRLQVYFSEDGVAATGVQSTVSTGLADGSAKWVRATLDVDNGEGGYDANFWLSDDGVTWVQLGSTVTGTSAISFFSTAADVVVGSTSSNTENLAAKVYRAQVFDGIDGSLVLDVDCSKVSSGADTSFGAVTGQTVSIARTLSSTATGSNATAVVTYPLWHIKEGTVLNIFNNDLLNFDETESFTILAFYRIWVTRGNYTAIVGKLQTQLTLGYAVYNNIDPTHGGYVHDGTRAFGRTGAYVKGTLGCAGAVVDRDAATLTGINYGSFLDSPSDLTGFGSLVNTGNLAIARRGGVEQQMEFYGFVLWRRVLSEAEVARAYAFYSERIR